SFPIEEEEPMNAPPKKSAMLSASNGIKIFYRHYPAEVERARVVIAHGLGEHSGRYANVVDAMRAMGVSVWALDHRGHGQSDGKRGHILNFTQFLSDLHLMVKRTREGLPAEMKCFLLGHSMGGLIVLLFSQRFPDLIEGVIVSSPALGMIFDVPRAKKLLGLLMSYIWPSLTMSNELDVTKISHDPEVVSAYCNDSLVHDRVSARFFTEFLSAMETAHQNATAIEVPILMQIAGDDYLVNADSSLRFFDKLDVRDKTLRLYNGMYHEIYNECGDEKQRVFADLHDWLERHIS
ncbi:MAG: lysophospholipase, partial [Desulfobacterales bacterium]